MAIHLNSEYRSELVGKGGWLGLFIFVSLLEMFAWLRGAAASVVSGGVGGTISLTFAALLVVALVGLLLRKRWSYYLYLLTGVFMLLQLGTAMLAAPDSLLLLDWKFDMPILIEWLVTLLCVLYFLSSKRVYSTLLAKDPVV